MVKRWLLVGMIFLLVPWFVVGCGVAQEQYDAVVSERDTAQAELQSVKTELQSTTTKLQSIESELKSAKEELQSIKSEASSSQAKVSELTSSLETSRTELEATQAEYNAFKSDLSTLWTSLDKKLELGAYLITYWAAAGVGDEATVGQMTLNMVKYVDAVGNTELSQTWQDAMNYAAQGKEAEFMANFSLVMIKTIELSGEDIEALDAKLSK